jgi:peroxiredoxin
VVVFSLPGAFTPTCSSTHLPRYNEVAPVFFANGQRIGGYEELERWAKKAA